jgi:hypothetical protein
VVCVSGLVPPFVCWVLRHLDEDVDSNANLDSRWMDTARRLHRRPPPPPPTPGNMTLGAIGGVVADAEDAVAEEAVAKSIVGLINGSRLTTLRNN